MDVGSRLFFSQAVSGAGLGWCASVESVKAKCFVKSSACRRVLLGVIARLGVLDGLILRAGRGRGVSERCGAARREAAAKVVSRRRVLFRGGGCWLFSSMADGGGFAYLLVVDKILIVELGHGFSG